MDVLTGDEAAFYADHLSDQNCRISMDVGFKYVNEKQIKFEKEQFALEQQMIEKAFTTEEEFDSEVNTLKYQCSFVRVI